MVYAHFIFKVKFIFELFLTLVFMMFEDWEQIKYDSIVDIPKIWLPKCEIDLLQSTFIWL